MANVKEMIEKRAYELYLKRGGVHGYAMEDWQKAEKEILAELAAAKKTETRASAGPVYGERPVVRPATAEPASPVREKTPEPKPPVKTPRKGKSR